MLRIHDPRKGTVAVLTFCIAHPALESYGALVNDLRLGKGLNPIGRARAMTYSKYFLTLGWVLFFARTNAVEQ